MFLKGVSGMVDKIMSIPNVTQELLLDLVGNENTDINLEDPTDVHNIDLNVGVAEEGVGFLYLFT